MKIPGLEDVLRAGKKVPWETILRGVLESQHNGSADVFERMRSGAGTEILEQLRVWGSHLSRNALTRWTAAVMTPVTCYECTALGLVHCEACGRRACLEHSLVGYDASGICEECAAKVSGKRKTPPPRAEPRRAVPKKQPGVAAAWKTLGVEPGTPFEEVKRRYRKLVLDFNADRPQDARQRARNTERLKKLNAAFAVIREHYEGRKAA